jgi:hypothetical protein
VDIGTLLERLCWERRKTNGAPNRSGFVSAVVSC